MSSTTTSKKRKSDANSTATAKKIKSESVEACAQIVQDVLSDALAQYARGLEEEVNATKPKEKSPTELADAVSKLAATARSGITKQMGWKPSCQTGKAKWVYDGLCNDPHVFGALLGLDGPPNFKIKKFSKEEFQKHVGDIKASVRYASLWLMSDVTVKWESEEGTFKFSGTYGKL